MHGWRGYIMIVALLFSSVLLAAENPLELTHIRLSPEFIAKMQSQNQLKAMGLKAAPVADPVHELIPFLFDQEIAQSNTAHKENNLHLNTKSSTPTDGQESLLFGQIRTWLDARYQGIGQGEADRVNMFNNQFNLGVQNFSGFSWQKPFGGFGLYVDRQISPDLFDQSRWIVMDTFTVVIEATTFLGKMSEAGAVSMSASEIAAFAGINFKRVYTTYHFAPSFSEALIADFRYLFLPFLAHTPQGALALDEGKILKREDTWSVGAGGLIESPPWYGLSFSAGALVDLTNTSTLILQSIKSGDTNIPGEFLRVSHKSAQKKSAGVSAALQLDFFKIIKFTLLSYDLTFEAEKNKEFQLSFKENNKMALSDGSETSQEFSSLLRKNAPEIRFLEPYVLSLNEGENSATNSRAMLLLWGNLKKSSMEQVRVIKDQVVKTFFRSYSESIRLVQNFWSRLFSSFIFRIFQFNTGVRNDAAFTRKISIEYEATLAQSPDPDKMTIENHEQFSMTVGLSYEAARTDRWVDRSYKKDAENYIDRYTTLPADLKTLVRNGDLKGPLLVTTNVRVMGDGLVYFNNLTEAQVSQEFNQLCNQKSSCVKKLLEPYQKYKSILTGTGRYELAQLKKMMAGILKEIDDLATFQVLFGENAFVNGSFYATSKVGMPYSTQYTLGQFRGLGVIDNYKRLNGTRQPASIWSE
ncbi:MAG: hypothetical protein K2P81_00110 [Bacteriovoracaceae bacterium]|nr:hypothetical protein [Bacteriovoracaceae bacterium]